jgi:hypothetical protein
MDWRGHSRLASKRTSDWLLQVPGFGYQSPAQASHAPTAGRFYRPELDIVRF